MTAGNRVRLACIQCDRADMDGITPEQLAQAERDGWTYISEFQTYEQSIQVFDDPMDPDMPEDYSVFDWYTHTGYCPECNPDVPRDPQPATAPIIAGRIGLASEGTCQDAN